MEFRIERKVTFVEEAYIEADSLEDLKEKLKTSTLDWHVDFEFNPEIEAITAYEEDSGECFDRISCYLYIDSKLGNEERLKVDTYHKILLE